LIQFEKQTTDEVPVTGGNKASIEGKNVCYRLRFI